jgi:hypothetical protein
MAKGYLFHSSPVSAATSYLCRHRPPLPYVFVHRPDQPSAIVPSSSLLRIRLLSHATLAVLRCLPRPQRALGQAPMHPPFSTDPCFVLLSHARPLFSLTQPQSPPHLSGTLSPCSLSSGLASATRVLIGSPHHRHPPLPSLRVAACSLPNIMSPFFPVILANESIYCSFA